MKNYFISLSLFLLVCITAPVSAQEEPSSTIVTPETVVIKGFKNTVLVDYPWVIARMKEFESLKQNEKIYLRLFVKLEQETTKMSDLKLTFDSSDIDLTIVVEPDGTVIFPISEQAKTNKIDVMVNQKEGSVKIYYGPGIKLPLSTTFKYKDLMDGVKQSTSMMKKFWSFLFPSFKGASLRYAEANGQYVTIQTQKGDVKIMIDVNRKSIPIELDSDLYEENPTIIATEMPLKILPFNVSPSK